MQFVKCLKNTAGRPIGLTVRKVCVVGLMTTIRSTIGLATELLMREKDAMPIFFS